MRAEFERQAQMKLHDGMFSVHGPLADFDETHGASVEQPAIQERQARRRGTGVEHTARLRHDVRQPLTTIRMNLQTAVRLLQRPEPLVPAALDAILDCLDAEREAARLLADGD